LTTQKAETDFPLANPPTHGTGLWSKNEFHKIKSWGKKQ